MAAVPITAYALANALGSDTETVVEGLFTGRSGLVTGAAATEGLLPFEPACREGLSGRHARLAGHVVSLAESSIAAACRRWGAHRVGIVVGSSVADLEVQQLVTGARGPTFVVSTGCTSSAKALGSAQRSIGAGFADAMLVIGIETSSPTVQQDLDALSSTRCRPFCTERRGANLGEGAALLLLERTGDTHVALVAVGEANEPEPTDGSQIEGSGLEAAMRRALELGDVDPAQIGHVQAHATGSTEGDAAEARAIRRVLGERVPVVSTKGYTGHLLSAAGATGAVLAAISMERGWLPASIGCEPLDSRLGIRVMLERTQIESDYALCTSVSPSGSCAAVLLGVRG